MKNIFYFILIGITISSCSTPKAPEFEKIKNVHITSQKGAIYTITADAICSNPNSIGGDLLGMEMDIFVDDVEVAHLSQEKSAVIQPESEFTVPIIFEMDINKVLGENKGFLQGALSKLLKNSLDVKFKGHLKVKFLEVKFKVPVDFTEEMSLGLKGN